ncbi:anti-anti-sigma factor [Oceanobacillus chungangensis]|uniref:Anti-anti-sigma factor n=2 Tax=Oceanobacillus chungangensis TaxID=1229152 RepID=A0A3D8PNT0_9BACI|nr:STAS domain-containing protein [Oceanobacillus chungangensis]RDW16891.1 anti-anti-sigma factor [Oceanobacillus chungangensis]
MLLSEAGNVATKINTILEEGNIDLLKNAETIALYVVGNKREELIDFAEVEGISWAKYSLTLALKLEWIHALRRTLWQLLRENDPLNSSSNFAGDFYELEQTINDGIDEFLNSFFISYSNYKDELIMNQRKLVEHLSVPIIPVSSSIAVLPMIGMFDSYRMDIIEEKVLNEISKLRINTLIIDLSGITDMDEYTVAIFQQVLTGIKLMGSKSILTGLRPQLARKMVHLGTNMKNTEIKGTLQQALDEYFEIKA